MARDGGGEAGFTLLEVVIAFAIAALALGVLYQGALVGLRSAAIAGRTEEAVSRARSHLAALGHGTPLAPGDQEGDDGGGYRWHTRITTLATARARAGETLDGEEAIRRPVTLYAVNVAITWRQDGRERQVELDSRRLAVGAPVTQ
jgi:general secretion pathway protein I